jgi:chromosomal replication initiation ATPase DnaA
VVCREGDAVIVTPAEILLVVCRKGGVIYDDIISTSRHRQLVVARRVYVALCRELTDASYPEISRAMRKTSHSHAIAQIKAFNDERKRDKHQRWLYDACWLEVRRMQREKAEREQEAARC